MPLVYIVFFLMKKTFRLYPVDQSRMDAGGDVEYKVESESEKKTK
jgi:hypothetical protein